MRSQIVVISFLVAISGCTIPNPFVRTTEQKIEKAELTKGRIDVKINQQTRQFVTGAKEILESKEDELNKEEEMSLDLVVQAERLLGGEPIEKIDIGALSDLYDSDKEKYKSTIGEKAKTVTLIKKHELEYGTAIASLEQRLEKEKAKGSWWNRIINAIRNPTAFLIVAVILLLIFAPRVLCKVLGWMVTKIPSLISFLGVTSARVVKALVKGVQKVRSQIAELPEGTTLNLPNGTKLNRKQILNMIDSALKEEYDCETKNTVEVLREKYDLGSVSSKLADSESDTGCAPSVTG